MGTTWKQKRAIVSQFISDNYGESLQQEGFVSYGDEAINWYRIKNGLLYTIHMMSDIPSPFWINPSFGVHSLF